MNFTSLANYTTNDFVKIMENIFKGGKGKQPSIILL